MPRSFVLPAAEGGVPERCSCRRLELTPLAEMSVNGCAAIHDDVRAGHKRRLVACQKESAIRDL